MCFQDSFNFLSTSLDKLVQVRRKDKKLQDLIQLFPNTYDFFKKNFPDISEDQFTLLTSKGVYPYSYMDREEKFNENCLPPQHEFTNVDGEIISTDQYKFAQNLWSKFKLKNLGELHVSVIELLNF